MERALESNQLTWQMNLPGRGKKIYLYFLLPPSFFFKKESGGTIEKAVEFIMIDISSHSLFVLFLPTFVNNHIINPIFFLRMRLQLSLISQRVFQFVISKCHFQTRLKSQLTT